MWNTAINDRVVTKRRGLKESGDSHSLCPSQASRMSRRTHAKEIAVKSPKVVSLAKNAVFTLAEIKAAAEAFDRGETNVFDALEAIVVAVDAYQATAQPRRAAA